MKDFRDSCGFKILNLNWDVNQFEFKKKNILMHPPYQYDNGMFSRVHPFSPPLFLNHDSQDRLRWQEDCGSPKKLMFRSYAPQLGGLRSQQKDDRLT